MAQAGYVPRNKQPTASGLTSSTMVGKGKAKDQELDNESAAGLKKVQETDSEINAGLAAIDKTLDNLNALAGAMKDEVRLIILNNSALFDPLSLRLWHTMRNWRESTTVCRKQWKSKQLSTLVKDSF